VREEGRPLNMLIALAMLGSAITGTLALIAALWVLIQGEALAAGLCLLAAAVAYGLLAMSILRDVR
jgi:hypothetical protein